MDRAEWLALAKRCEEAKGPDREIDYDLGGMTKSSDYGWPLSDDLKDHLLQMKPRVCEECCEELGTLFTIVPYTTCLTSIVSLIERELPDLKWSTGTKGYINGVYQDGKARADIRPAISSGWTIMGIAATPALALCAAFCLAMSEKVDGSR